MGSDARFLTGILIRLFGLALSLAVMLWAISAEPLRPAVLVTGLSLTLLQSLLLVRSMNAANHELARIIEAIAAGDLSQNIAAIGRGRGWQALRQALAAALARLGEGRREADAERQTLRALVEHVPAALLTIDSGGRCALLNGAARRLFVRPELGDLNSLAEHGAEFARAIEALRPGERRLVVMSKPLAQTVAISAAQVTSAKGPLRLIAIDAVGRDLEGAEAKAIRDLLRTMTHEVMNSLAPISSLSVTARDLLALPDAAPEDRADAAAALETIARRAEGLRHYVDATRQLNRELIPARQPVPVMPVFSRIATLLGPELESRGIRLTLSCEPPGLVLEADPGLIDQALINLIRNAIDAVSDAPLRAIRFFARLDALGRVELGMADSGPGVADADLAQLFMPYFTTKAHGTGIGLAVVRQIAVAHGGTVRCERDPELGGAAFILSL